VHPSHVGATAKRNIPGPEILTLQMGLKKHNDDFLEKEPNDFNSISVIYGDHLPK
jgi:hypothetical protein